MRLALYLPNFRDKVTVSELDDLAHLAEELEFDSIWTAADGAPRRAGARRRRGDRGGGHRSGRVRTPFLTFADRNVRSCRRSRRSRVAGRTSPSGQSNASTMVRIRLLEVPSSRVITTAEVAGIVVTEIGIGAIGRIGKISATHPADLPVIRARS